MTYSDPFLTAAARADALDDYSDPFLTVSARADAYSIHRLDPIAEPINRPTCQRRDARRRLDEIVAGVEAQILAPIRMARLVDAVESGDLAEMRRWANELARNVADLAGGDE